MTVNHNFVHCARLTDALDVEVAVQHRQHDPHLEERQRTVSARLLVGVGLRSREHFRGFVELAKLDERSERVVAVDAFDPQARR